MGKPAAVAAQRQFVVNRMARVYPMFVMVVLACFFIRRLGAPIWTYNISSLHDVWINLGFVQGYNILWTIGPEIIFYFLFLILWRSWCFNKSTFAILAIAMAAVAWLPITVTSANSLARLHDKLPYFLAGCMLGLRSDQLIASGIGRKRTSHLAFWLCLGAFVLGFPQVIHMMANVPKRLTGDPWPDPWSFPFYLVATVCLFIVSVVASPWLLTNRFACFIGKISYSFYLLHFAVLQNVKIWMPRHPWISIVLGFVLTTVISSLTYFSIETPMRRLIRHVFSWPKFPLHHKPASTTADL
jgi:peptidoglycan/LPS O-acetylase OafA/YrhL